MANSNDPQLILEFERVIAALNERAAENVIIPGLDRISYLMSILGDSHTAMDVIHVAGTNGKTSTSRMIESLLSAASLNTGLTTSPHLHDVRERIRIYGQPVPIETFVETFDDIAPYLEMTDEHFTEGRLSYFETMTAMAFSAFAQAPVDVAVVEVGLGGRWDATNVVEPAVCVITPIGLDHQNYLGDTIELIAAEKAGIIKPGAIVVVGMQDPRAMEVIKAKADEVGAALLVQGIDFGVVDRSLAVGGQVLTLRGAGGIYEDVILPLHGEHQANNASLALAAVEAFFGAGVEGKQVDADIVAEGFGKATSPGRLEVVRRGPTVIVDAAHNPHGGQALVAALSDEFGFDKIIAVVGMFADKDAEGFLTLLEPVVDHIIITQTNNERAISASELADLARTVFDADRVDEQSQLTDAIARAIELADESAADDAAVGIVITGSVYTVAQARALLGKRSA
ncbi:MAG: hypothetical protein RL441_645 [Actinomycetota bacterium]